MFMCFTKWSSVMNSIYSVQQVYSYTERRYADFHFAERTRLSFMLIIIYADCHAESNNTKCCYADCHYAECHCAYCHYADCCYADCHLCSVLSRWESLYWVSLCWVLLCLLPSCWLSLCWLSSFWLFRRWHFIYFYLLVSGRLKSCCFSNEEQSWRVAFFVFKITLLRCVYTCDFPRPISQSSVLFIHTFGGNTAKHIIKRDAKWYTIAV